MKPKTRAVILLAALVIALLAIAGGVAWAQTGGPYDLSWNTIDGGGATFSSGGTGVAYEVGGTIGQADAGTMSGGSGVYGLDGGFWYRAGTQPTPSPTPPSPSKQKVYLPAVLRK